jgi:hypothetical protein
MSDYSDYLDAELGRMSVLNAGKDQLIDLLEDPVPLTREEAQRFHDRYKAICEEHDIELPGEVRELDEGGD